MRTLAVERTGRIWRLTLNRSQLGNAIDAAMVQEFDAVLSEGEASGIAGLVIQGAGRHFCTGFDLGALDGETDDSLLARFVRVELLLQRIAQAPFTTVAMAHGRVIGAGADLFTACRLRLASSDAVISFPGASGFGIVLGTRRLAQRVGVATALEWVETGRTVASDEAVRCGLIDRLVDERPMAGCPIEAGMRDGAVRASLRRAAEPGSAAGDASDLEHLVRSAARHGLKDRIVSYVQTLQSASSTK
ncbi:MAG: enoyl-CoA hydratase/isomerase family protein [Rubrivivax sp.]